MNTTQTTSRHGIVVGVTGGGQDVAAMGWAAARAAASGSRVTLAHAYGHVLPPPPPSVLLAPEPLTESASFLLHASVETYQHLVPAQAEKPEALLDAGRPRSFLVELSKEAELVVLTHRTHRHRIVTGSTAASVAARARCPVVSVPEHWSPGHGAPGHEGGWVTVGIHEDGEPGAVLDAAVHEAMTAGAPLRLVHAWRLDSVYDDVIATRIDPEWRARVEERMLRSVAEVVAAHPGLRVEVQAVHEWPADALESLASSSRLLVVGRHAHHASTPPRLGSVARALLRASGCPVMVVPVPSVHHGA